MTEPRKRGRPPGKRFERRFNFALTTDLHDTLHAIADLANDDAAEVVRRMVERETPFFLYYASVNKSLPNGKDK